MDEFKPTYFGFQEVSPEEKTTLVDSVFHRVARRYDLMNDVMSMGIHRFWKDSFIRKMNPFSGAHLLDMAGGTGDIAFRFLKTFPSCHVTVCDKNLSMLEVGQDRAWDRGIIKGLEWLCADASVLPFPEKSFDLYSIAFGLRNVTFRTKALQEAFRILKPGGKFFCLEFSKVHVPGLREVYQFYSFHLIPYLGRWVAQDQDAYKYLVESISQFPDQKRLEEEIQEVGFRQTQVHNLSGGIVAIHQGLKI
jgi:demethylmenaquinone methyltransferase/2-methoxy-6-polyprenyl-1,4-benzoquinol methylase